MQSNLFAAIIAILFASAAFTSSAQDKKELDKEAIKSMCGCYSVTFDYAETFHEDTTYELHDQYHAMAPAEWVFVAEETEDKIVLQHILVINDTTIIKHWRQDWVYENRELYEFENTMAWDFRELPAQQVEGQWSQKVYQVDDSPRYEGSATWVHVDGKHFWENTTDAPLPRREFSKRNDYNVMQRTNRHEITEDGWVHEQDNLKIVRENGEDKVLVAEKGINEYTKIDKSRCQPGIEWWQENEAYWALVREEWNNVFGRNQDLELQKKVDEKLLWQALFGLEKEKSDLAEKKPEKVKKDIRLVIESYIVGEQTGSTK